MKNLEPDLLATFAPAATSPRWARYQRMALISLTGLVLAVVTVHVALNLALNRNVRSKVVQLVSSRLPGSSLRLGALRYDFWRNRLRCESLELTLAGGGPARTGILTLSGVNWFGLMAKNPSPTRLFRHAKLAIGHLSADSSNGEYRFECGHLSVSVPAAEVAVHQVAFQPLVSDEAFFAADSFRRIRYRLAAAACTVRGVDFAEIFTGKAYRAESVELKTPLFESYVDREKPRRAPTRVPPMPHEALAAINPPFRLARLIVTDGTVRIMGRRFAGGEPGVLTITRFGLAADDVANPAGGGQIIALKAKGTLMDAGAMTLQMSIPVQPATFAYRYSGTLGEMDLTQLNAYLSGTGGFEIKSGRTRGASFEVDVADGQARGLLKGAYEDLQVTVLDPESGSEKGITNRVATVIANQIKVRHENTPDKAGRMKEGRIEHARTPEDTFLQFSWIALRSGITDLLTL